MRGELESAPEAKVAVHPTAIISPEAELASDVEVGPYVVIDGRVRIGAGCRILPHAYITGWTEMGEGNVVHPGAVVGGEPQDLAFKGGESYCRIGSRNVIREGAQIHRGVKPGSETVVGDDCYLMADSHVAHNCRLGNSVILANCALLAGYVRVGDRAFVSGGAAVHQFVRIGTHAFISGNSSISMDVPPYFTAQGRNVIVQVNKVGLRRSPVVPKESAEAIARAFRLLYRSGLGFTEALEKLAAEPQPPEVAALIEFFRSSERGVCGPSRHRRQEWRSEKD